MKPWRKSDLAAQKTEPPKLTVITGGTAPKRAADAEPSYRLIFGFLGVAAAVLGLIIYFSPGNRFRWESVTATFTSLDTVYKTQGMEKFLERKELLKKAVTETLNNSTDPAQLDLATNISVFLFPELLPDDNFEKLPAEEMWGFALKKIEQSPHTAESRVLFEALRADIWNYELVDREDPKLSLPATQVIRIYDIISAP